MHIKRTIKETEVLTMSYETNATNTDTRLKEDKEYLSRCLEHTKDKIGIFNPNCWWQSEETVITVARILLKYGTFTALYSSDLGEKIIDYFEKPYAFENDMRFIVEEM